MKNPKFQPSLSKYKNLVEKQLRPKARKDIIEFFNSNKIKPNSMIDISDGLSSELFHISNSSNLGLRFLKKNYNKYEVISISEELKIKYLDAALNGGENMIIIFFTISVYEKIKLDRIEITPLGHFTESTKVLVLKDGKEINMESKGWNHFKL